MNVTKAGLVAVILCLLASSPAQADSSVIITEFMASNTRTLADEDNTYPDWLEIQNISTNTVSLEGWYLTDSAKNLTKWSFPATNLFPSKFMVIFASGKDRRVPGAPLHTSFKLSKSGGYLALTQPDGTTIATQFAPKYPQQFPDVSYGFGTAPTNFALVPTNSPVRAFVPADDSLGNAWILPVFDDGAWIKGTNGVGYDTGSPSPYTSLIGANVGGAMVDVNSSCYVRYGFSLDDPSVVDRLTLRLKYDDGFAAYLNGSLVAAQNAPSTNSSADAVDWNSAATAPHASDLATNFESFSLDDWTTALLPGSNVLAIQGLNISPTNSAFLIYAGLDATTSGQYVSSPRYFVVPTPGSLNGAGTADLGPVISDAGHSPYPVQPRTTDSITVTARVSQAFSAVSAVNLTWCVMFGATNRITMFDDGLHGDGAAGDGVYGATIPAGVATPGQMVRWFITASDLGAHNSRWPLFTDPNATAEYLGTVIYDPTLTSKLPIFHLFVSPTNMAGVDLQTGGRASFFYDGEFYDNIYMEVRGNTSATLNKKAHRLEFNREHLFRHLPGYPLIQHTSLLCEYLDPAYLRQHLCFWFLNMIGLAAPFDYPVRVQMNASFYQLAFHNDVLGDEQLARLGYDPEGALYKCAGRVDPAFDSTGGFQKLLPKNVSDRSDYLQLANGINEATPTAQRRNAVFDLLDVPQVVNYLTGARWCSENDDVWANMSLYRDTKGDGLWRIVPYDMNASWGQLYGGSSPLSVTNDNSKSHPLYGGSQVQENGSANWNRIYDVIITLPETRQMLLCRERTVLDRWAQPPGTDPKLLIIENYIQQMTNLIWVEANIDRTKWGFSPWAPNQYFTNGVNDLFNQFMGPRRLHWAVKHCVTNTALPVGLGNNYNAGMPLSQPVNAFIAVASLDYNPVSGNQSEEYLCVTNPMPFALDISGWKLAGAVDFTFKPGTVMPSNSVLYVSPDVTAFRARATGPRGGMGLFVVGPYQGHLSARGETVQVQDTFSRLISTYTYPDNSSPVQKFLRIVELMYHPAPLAGNTNDAEQFEYVAFKNISSNATLNLAGVRFTNGIEFAFAGSAVTSLGPGQVVLIVKNTNAFAARYGAGFANLAGQYGGSLNNGGERLQLVDAAGEEIHDFTYDNNWYPITDGLGFSLVVVDPYADPGAWSSSSNWRPSGTVNGPPGAGRPAASGLVPVVLNEVLTRSDMPPPSCAIELFNPTTNLALIGGWFLTDDFNTPKKFRIPNGTVLPAGSYLTFEDWQFDPNPGVPPSFELGTAGGNLYLFSADAGTNLTGYYHGFNFGGADDGMSFGRYVTSDGKEHFAPQLAPTLGTNNAGPQIGPVVINEIMYHPPEIGGTNDNTDDEFVELLNTSSNTVFLFDATTPTNTWKITGGIDFVFPTNLSLAAGEYLLLVNFDPTNMAMRTAFCAKYGVNPMVQIFGPYGGKLSNAGDDVELKRGITLPEGQPASVLVDKVDYQDSSPWPAGADGFGLSLQRLDIRSYGNEPTNWIAAAPAAAGPTRTGGTGPMITAQPASQAVPAYSSLTLTLNATGSAPLRYQWRFNGANISGATNATLQLPSVQLENNGDYKAVVFNDFGSDTSSNANLAVIVPPVIWQQPQSVSVWPLTNITFTVGAFSPTALSFQWSLNGTNIPGATNATYAIGSVQPNHAGDYVVRITDSVGPSYSTPAHLTVIAHPLFTLQPYSRVIVLTGSAVNVTNVAAAYSTTPVRYQWRFNGADISGATNATFIITNVQESNNGDYAVVASDNFGSITSTNGTLMAAFKPVITQQPQPTNLVVLTGTNVSFTVSASGTPPLYYRWRKNAIGTNTIMSSNSHTFTIPAVITNAAYYDVVITNIAGATVPATSQKAYLTVMEPLADQTVPLGSNATFNFVACSYYSTAATQAVYVLKYQWWFNGTNLLAGFTNATLTVTNAQYAKEGPYTVVATNANNTVASQTARLSILRPPVITQSPSNQTVVAGTTASFRVFADGTAPLTYLWFFNQSNLLTWAAGPALALTNLQARDAGWYSVVVSNAAGTTNSVAARLVVVTPDMVKVGAVTMPSSSNQNVTISFSAVAGLSYSVQYRDQLDAGDWQTLTNIPAQSTNQAITVEDADAIGKPQRFYRIVAPMRQP